MSLELILALFALLISVVSSIWAYWSAREARSSNDIGRLNALLSMRSHYLALMAHQSRMVNEFQSSSGLVEAARNAYADLDARLNEVNREIDKKHEFLVGGSGG